MSIETSTLAVIREWEQGQVSFDELMVSLRRLAGDCPHVLAQRSWGGAHRWIRHCSRPRFHPGPHTSDPDIDSRFQGRLVQYSWVQP